MNICDFTSAHIDDAIVLPILNRGVSAIVKHYEAIIGVLEAPPLLVGHSFGGLVVQLLLDRGIGSAGIAIAPLRLGGMPGPVPLAAAFPIIARWNGWNRSFMPDREAFDRTFANTASPQLRASAYARLVVPAPGRIFYAVAAFIGTFIKPQQRSVPLMLISGEQDRNIIPFVVRSTYGKQKHSLAPTTLKNFAGRSHFIIAEPGWEDVAQYALHWAQNQVLLPHRQGHSGVIVVGILVPRKLSRQPLPTTLSRLRSKPMEKDHWWHKTGPAVSTGVTRTTG